MAVRFNFCRILLVAAVMISGTLVGAAFSQGCAEKCKHLTCWYDAQEFKSYMTDTGLGQWRAYMALHPGSADGTTIITDNNINWYIYSSTPQNENVLCSGASDARWRAAVGCQVASPSNPELRPYQYCQ